MKPSQPLQKVRCFSPALNGIHVCPVRSEPPVVPRLCCPSDHLASDQAFCVTDMASLLVVLWHALCIVLPVPLFIALQNAFKVSSLMRRCPRFPAQGHSVCVLPSLCCIKSVAWILKHLLENESLI